MQSDFKEWFLSSLHTLLLHVQREHGQSHTMSALSVELIRIPRFSSTSKVYETVRNRYPSYMDEPRAYFPMTSDEQTAEKTGNARTE